MGGTSPWRSREFSGSGIPLTPGVLQLPSLRATLGTGEELNRPILTSSGLWATAENARGARVPPGGALLRTLLAGKGPIVDFFAAPLMEGIFMGLKAQQTGTSGFLCRDIGGHLRSWTSRGAIGNKP